MHRVSVSALLLALCAVAAWAQQPIRVSETNYRYWEYNGAPVILLGGSKEDNLFQIPDLKEHLDLLVSCGGNYIRNTMSSRDEGNVWPFAQREDGKYDLEKTNDEYFRRFESALQLAKERGIIVQIEMWDRFDFAQRFWSNNPYRPANNINYTGEMSGLKNEYPDHPGSNKNPFFRSVPALDNNALLLKYQHAQVDRMLSISLKFPNVLYCMDNETSGWEEWGAYWSDYVHAKAKEAGVTVNTTEMWDAWNLKDDVHKRTLDRPDRYSFADISQNNHNTGQTHWDNLQWVRDYIKDKPRPLNHVKIYGADGGRFGGSRDGIERFWRGLIGGAASVRFHRPGSGLGLSEIAQAHIRSARKLSDRFSFINAEPDVASTRLLERDANEAYATTGENNAVVVYFTDGGAVKLDAPAFAHGATVEWLDASTSAWQEALQVETNPIPLVAPGAGHWIALVRQQHVPRTTRELEPAPQTEPLR
ncbi:MAG TPA: hypothetical protein PLJ47_01445 [Candidatus Hydrogenedentes bacterium]|mgnify:CR=1 FL=1|nr:hypothetical protein [Candidatus Hydrogenedentota bacterium]